jgi:hypothetical protein
MIHKIILSGSYDFDEPSVALVPLHSRGVDQGWMHKRASGGMFEKEISELKPDPKRTVLHVIAVGDEERYGDNRNGDAFNREDNKERHGLFKSAGHVFKNHKNHSPALATGEILATTHNDDMDRIEILAGLDNSKYAEELAGFEKGEDIPVSMGSMQDYDVCSYCKHKAKTPKQHCDHIRTKLGEVTEDGTKIYMQNPKPGYFDLSTVFKPADRIGYALRKVASENGVVGGHELAEHFGLRMCGSIKHATLVRLAEMEKHTKATGKPIPVGPNKLSDHAVQQLKRACDHHGVDHVLGRLHRSGQLLSFPDFTEVIVGKSKLALVSEDNLHSGFGRLLDDPTEIEDLDGCDDPDHILMDEGTHHELHNQSSMHQGPVRARVLKGSIETLDPTRGVPKFALAIDDVEARGLADLYLHYKLAFASNEANRHNPSILQAVVCSNTQHPSCGPTRPV